MGVGGFHHWGLFLHARQLFLYSLKTKNINIRQARGLKEGYSIGKSFKLKMTFLSFYVCSCFYCFLNRVLWREGTDVARISVSRLLG